MLSGRRAHLAHACARIRDLRRFAGVATASIDGLPRASSCASAMPRKESTGTRSIAKYGEPARIALGPLGTGAGIGVPRTEQ